jgi:hypothetical protein
MVGAAQLVNGVHQCGDMFGRSVLRDAMSEIEDMSGPFAILLKH